MNLILVLNDPLGGDMPLNETNFDILTPMIDLKWKSPSLLL